MPNGTGLDHRRGRMSGTSASYRRGAAGSSQRRGARAPPLPSLVAAESEQVGLHGDTGVESDELRERETVVEAEERLDRRQREVSLVVEAVAASECRELLLPHRELELAELGALHVLLSHHADEGIDRIHVAVERLEARREGGAPHAGDGVLEGFLRPERDGRAVRVTEEREVE